MVALQGDKMIALLWRSTTVRMLSYPCDTGSPTMKSIVMASQTPSGTSFGLSGTFTGGHILVVWQVAHLSRASPAPPDLNRGSHAKPPSPPNPPLKPSYSQIVKTKIQARDPGAMARAPAMKGSRYRKVPGSIPTKDNYLARDPGNLSRVSSRDPLLASAPRDQSHDLIRSRDPTRPRDQVRFGRATRPLTNTWKTVGTNQRSTRSQGIPQGIPHSLSPMDTGTGNTLIGLRA